MSDGKTHYKYYMMGYGLVLPSSFLLTLYDFKFALGNLLGYTMGRWLLMGIGT